MEVLFISHKYPPATGGMEKFSFELARHMEAYTRIHLIVYRGEIPRWLWFVRLRRMVDEILVQHPGIGIIHLNDGLMVSFGLWIKKRTSLPVVATLHGLDVVFPLPFFQDKILPRFNSLNGLACVSSATKEAAILRGIKSKKCIVINNGVDHELLNITPDAAIIRRLRQQLSIPDGKTIITGMGRAVKRKGFSWFVSEVLPHLPENVVFVMCGPISDYSPSRWVPGQWSEQWALMMGHATDEPKLKQLADLNPNRFIRTGYLPFGDIIQLLKASEAFVMPNIEVKGDMEGFGLVALEAVLAGTIVFAADREGIQDAIKQNENGYLLPSGDGETWIRVLNQHLMHTKQKSTVDRFQQFTTEHYSWDKMAREYYEWFKTME